MSKKEMAEAMLAGKTLVNTTRAEAWYDETMSPPFRFSLDADHDSSQPMLTAWDATSWKIKPEPKKRPMTREEILGKVTTIVVRAKGCEWAHPGNFAYSPRNTYEWATIDAKGNIGTPNAFEVEE